MSEVIVDGVALVGRHIKHIRRVPQKLLSVTVMPVTMVLAFGYILGSAMDVPGVEYRKYFMAGVFAQVMVAGMTTTGVGVCEDLNNGLMDRFRSLPMSRSAVLIGRTVSDLVLSAIACVVMSVVGFAIGWRIHGGFWSALAGFGLILLLGFVAIWGGALLGLALRSAEAVGSLGFVIVMPFMFLSSAFIPLNGLPGWLRAIAQWNPLTAVTDQCRRLWGNSTTAHGHGFAADHPGLVSLVSLAVLFVVIVPATVRSFGRAAAR
ncbi:ABC transporter permease [Streptomyces broussonetiae]|uniref:Transport permease protein n=1 Tax=Streptomyces broussonetiae TaxID=2686304 RepID=A0A6I6NCB8_9ACTN|nr:ABC transporter permease [Streptomyces broussonetiae]QHA06585.1 ABC transporter permease [Streptomyces broussonetiae]